MGHFKVPVIGREDNIREWTGLEFAKSKRAVENRRQWENGGNWLQNHLRCPNDPRGKRIGDDDDLIIIIIIRRRSYSWRSIS